MGDPIECAICLEDINNDDMIELQCNHKFHHECIINLCCNIRQSRNQNINEWMIELCPLCRTPITDDYTRICGQTDDGSPMIIIVDRNFSFSVDNGKTWSDPYENAIIIVEEMFGSAKTLLFERYSIIRDRSLYFTQSSSLKERNDLIEIYTFWPQNHETDDYLNDLLKRIEPTITICFTDKLACASVHLWLSLWWQHKNEL